MWELDFSQLCLHNSWRLEEGMYKICATANLRYENIYVYIYIYFFRFVYTSVNRLQGFGFYSLFFAFSFLCVHISGYIVHTSNRRTVTVTVSFLLAPRLVCPFYKWQHMTQVKYINCTINIEKTQVRSSKQARKYICMIVGFFFIRKMNRYIL